MLPIIAVQGLWVLLAGVNDVLARRTPERWGGDLEAILDRLADRTQLMVVAGIAPFDAFPSLPTALGRYLQEQAARLDRVSQQVCADRPRTTWISSTTVLPIRADFFASDGFIRRRRVIVVGHKQSPPTSQPSGSRSVPSAVSLS
jgi:hypothetical protein